KVRMARQTPGDVADPDAGIAGGAELLFHPGFAASAGFGIAIAAADNAETSGLRDRGGESAAGDAAHRRQKNRMADPEKPGQRRGDRHYSAAISGREMFEMLSEIWRASASVAE